MYGMVDVHHFSEENVAIFVPNTIPQFLTSVPCVKQTIQVHRLREFILYFQDTLRGMMLMKQKEDNGSTEEPDVNIR